MKHNKNEFKIGDHILIHRTDKVILIENERELEEANSGLFLCTLYTNELAIGDYFKVGKNIHRVVSIFGDSYRAEDGMDYREGVKRIPVFSIGDILSYNFNPKQVLEVANIIAGEYHFMDGRTAAITVGFTLIKNNIKDIHEDGF